jgi:thiol peroxidase
MAAKAKKAVKKSAKPAPRKAAARRPAVPAAPQERPGLIEVSGKPATVIGPDINVGQRAPHFAAQVGFWAGQDLWANIDPLEATAGKVRILTPLPSLDTSTCDAETRRFNQAAAGLGENIQVIVISTDLPVAQKRWCGNAGVDRVYTVSDHLDASFGAQYGTLIKERRWHRRAVFVVDQQGVVQYAAYMPKLGDQPNYEEVLATAKRLAGR